MFFTVEKIQKQLKEIVAATVRESCDLVWWKYQEGEFEIGTQGQECPEYDDRQWQNFRLGEYWGGYDRVAWFRTWLKIPDGWKEHKLALRFLPGPKDGGNSTAEAMLYLNGVALQAIDVWHTDAWLPPEFLESGEILVALKVWSGVLGVPDRRHFKTAQLLSIDESTERFSSLCSGLLKTVKILDENDLRRAQILQALNQAFLRIDFLKPRSKPFYQSVQSALKFLEGVMSAWQAVDELKPSVVGIGHAHIDMAWLWRLDHTREKAARTFTTALHLMRQYPEYRFLHSSPQLYKFLKTDYPDLYARLKEKIASGQWEITGGMWVEADTNMPGGESLIRQFLFGKRFVREEFGVEMKTLWLPDVFGYTWALPQIVKKSGLKYFLTSKISWSQFNRFPYDTFLWRGIDGSELLTHFVTTPEDNSTFYTYNGRLEPDEVKGIWDNYLQKEINDELLMLFGWGDGGGGPTREMLESSRTLRNLPGLPRLSLGKAEPYLERLEARLKDKNLPLWDGELYLEYHRGTYTSQAYNKRANRKAEVLFHNAEWLSSLADILSGQADYPVQALREGWELILLNQFHDILPGSSIRQVYEDSRKDYDRIQKIGRRAIKNAQRTIYARLSLPENALLIFNSLAWAREDVVEIPWSESLAAQGVRGPDGKLLPMQVSTASAEKKILLEASEVPALGYQAYPSFAQEVLPEGQLVDQTKEIALLEGSRGNGHNGNGRRGLLLGYSEGGESTLPESPAIERKESANLDETMTVTPGGLENTYYRIELNSRGQIISLWDKRNARQVLAEWERGNVFQAFEDKPMAFDAWDVDIYYQEKMREIDDLVEAVVEESGPLRGCLRLTWRFYDSFITQRITIYRRSPRIDFRTWVNWQEQQVLLKVAFPVDLRATRATYDIQFGNIERPTHWNTSWDYARFETLGHKWVDLSEGNYGVSLLNDCKYGHDVKNNVLRLTLIKSSIEPDQTADRGEHFFTYSLLPHAGDWRQADVARHAYELNDPLLVYQPEQETKTAKQPAGFPAHYQFAELDSDHVILETVKKAEAGDAWVVRVYENKQCRESAVRLSFASPLRQAVECNLMEEDEQPADWHGSTLTFPIKPYEIKTFKLWF